MSANGSGRPETAVIGRAALTPKQEAVALLLASGRTLAQAAKEADCGERTIRTWEADVPAFRARVAELRGRMTERVLGLLSEAACDAALTLADLLDSEQEGIRLKAADSILGHHAKIRETVELEARIAALEGKP